MEALLGRLHTLRHNRSRSWHRHRRTHKTTVPYGGPHTQSGPAGKRVRLPACRSAAGDDLDNPGYLPGAELGGVGCRHNTKHWRSAAKTCEMAGFRYDAVTLIELVETRPCLWDKTSDSFKDRTEKQNAWLEVCAFLEPKFHDIKRKQKIKIGQLIQGKWQNIRDAFVKSLKKMSGQSATKQYLYSANLQFLLKVFEGDDTDSSIMEPGAHSQESRVEESQVEETECEDDEEIKQRKRPTCDGRSNKRRIMNDIDREILKSLHSTTPDEDEAFFISITPAVRKMSADDKLEFRFAVLGLIRDIDKKAKNPEIPPVALSPASTASSHSHSTIPCNSGHSFTSDSAHFSSFSEQQQPHVHQYDRQQDIFGNITQ